MEELDDEFPTIKNIKINGDTMNFMIKNADQSVVNALR